MHALFIVAVFLLSVLVLGTSLQDRNQSNNITVTWSGVKGDSSCILTFRDNEFRCVLGRNGVTDMKIEGDGCTPSGTFPLRRGFFRADRLGAFPITPDFFPMNITLPNYGWSDDSSDSQYNQFVYLPYNFSYENLWLTDSAAYDLFAVIGYNDDPVIQGKGSAIFFHVSPSYGPTAGCVALSLDDLMWVLQSIQPDTYMIIA
jgi:L,D-peptidoglycan transpeptidase YkuD (ErfK/YbiS/YcfS/YnhG family)